MKGSGESRGEICGSYLFIFEGRTPMAEIKLPTNSITSGNAEKHEKKFEKVTTGKVVTKEKNDIQKVASMFIAEDLKTVRDHIIKDVAVPKLQDFFADLMIATINMIFHGDDRPRNNYNNYAQPSRVSYNRYSNQNSQQRPANAQINYQDVIFSSRGDADEVLGQMNDAVATYGSVSVADFYDLVGMTSNYTDNKYGWYGLNTAYIQPVSGGYIIRLPKPVALNN